jgi:hypothetical protein
MDSYLKELFGNSTFHSINIVDDNVSSVLDRAGRELKTNNHSNHQSDLESRSGRTHDSSSPVSRSSRCGDKTTHMWTIASRGAICNPTTLSATDHRHQRWESTTKIEDGAVNKMAKTVSQSAVRKPRRKSSGGEELVAGEAEATTSLVDRREIVTCHTSKFRLENHRKMESNVVLPDLVSSGPPRLSRSMDEISRLNTNIRMKVGSDPNHIYTRSDSAMMNQAPAGYSDEETWGKPYLVALKSDPDNKQTARRPYHSLAGPPEMPKRRTSDDSITLVAALEAAVAASPMSSSHTSLDSVQDGQSEGIQVPLRQEHSMLRLSPTSLMAASHLDFPMSFTGLPYELGRSD